MTPTPTQTAYPWRAVLRTIAQNFIPTIILIVGVGPEVLKAILDEPSLPAALREWLLGASALITAAAGILARIMAIPAVNRHLGPLSAAPTDNQLGG